MTTATLRKWGGAVAVSLPKKFIATLGLEAGSAVEVKIERDAIVLAPAKQRHTLARLEKEQRALDRAARRKPVDRDWLDGAARGREQL
ncbi:MAG: AbrB/MazE/SpoVT family DNA-binding domain-containing protein [Betaproteobacteria bacterium]|nr:AbrB/MazE/SpoVT family DNA-binding domain-containing protein [Betaproteobacteria bacterium]